MYIYRYVCVCVVLAHLYMMYKYNYESFCSIWLNNVEYTIAQKDFIHIYTMINLAHLT